MDSLNLFGHVGVVVTNLRSFDILAPYKLAYYYYYYNHLKCRKLYIAHTVIFQYVISFVLYLSICNTTTIRHSFFTCAGLMGKRIWYTCIILLK